MTRRLRTSLLTGIAALTLLDARVVWADGIHFMRGALGDYDNTPNVVTGTTATPTFTNNQTTGVFRDVFWWRNTADNPPNNPSAPFIHNPPTSISPDYINAGKNLVLCGISACDNGTGAHTALNFTGPNQSRGRQLPEHLRHDTRRVIRPRTRPSTPQGPEVSQFTRTSCSRRIVTALAEAWWPCTTKARTPLHWS